MERNKEITDLIAQFDARQKTQKAQRNRNREARNSLGRVASARRVAELAKLVVGAALGSIVLVAMIVLI